MAASKPDKRETALADVLADWATQPVLRDRLIASLEKQPLETIADLMGVEAKALRAKGKRAAQGAAARLLVVLHSIAKAEETNKIDYRLTMGSVREIFVMYVLSLSGPIGPLEAGAAGTVTDQAGNKEICQLRTQEAKDRYREYVDADQRWNKCAVDNDLPIGQEGDVCLAEYMNMIAAADAAMTAIYNKDIACSGIRD